MKEILKNVWLLGAILGFSCNSQTNTTKYVSGKEAHEILSKTNDIQLVDVRTEQEFNQGHINNSFNFDISLSDFEAKLSSLDKNKPLLLYCYSGGRSNAASSMAENMGFKEIYDLKGGIMAWRNAGYELSNGKPRAPKPNPLTSFNAEVAKHPLVLVDFYAPWCGPCKKMKPILDEIEKENAETLKIIRINTDEEDQLAQALGIEGLPTIHVYKNGKLYTSDMGFLNKKELLSMLK